ITIPAGSNIVLAMHYPHGSIGETDQSTIKFYFYEEEVEHREVSTYPLIQNWSFFLPANQETEVSATFSNFQEDVSLLSAFPHMHLLGEHIKSYAITPESEEIPLINIPHWDFEWQEFYFFQQLQRIPAGSTLHGEGTYNNSSENHHNPNDPPIGVGPGLNTSDEMFLVYYHYLPYLAGDELLDIEDLTSLPTHLNEVSLKASSSVTVFPNPASEEVNFKLDLDQSAKVSLSVYSTQGRLISKVIERQNTPQGTSTSRFDSSELTSGLYYYSLVVNGEAYSGQFMIK
ncbi:MAG: T9SS type A sorting domain-containing protein, partial [Flavobacteriales bacterium]